MVIHDVMPMVADGNAPVSFVGSRGGRLRMQPELQSWFRGTAAARKLAELGFPMGHPSMRVRGGQKSPVGLTVLISVATSDRNGDGWTAVLNDDGTRFAAWSVVGDSLTDL